jgi:hypothetical protein
VTVAAPAKPGYLTVYPAGSARPVTSNVNFVTGQTVANTVVVPVGSGGRVEFANLSPGALHLIVDVVGVYYDGSRAAGGLRPGQTLPSGGTLHTLHSEYVLTMQTQGDLVLRHGSTLVWHTNTGSHPGAKLTMLADGSMVIYSSTNQLLWNSRTSSHPGAGMSLLLDGSLSVALGTATLWSSAPVPYRSCDLVGADPAGTAITRWNPVTACVLGSLNQSSTNIGDVNIIIEYESGGDPSAINLWDLNAQEGHPSIGLIQVIAPTFNYYRSTLLANDLYDPAANLYAGLNYAIQTYGSIHNVPGLVSLRNGGGYKGYIVTR